MLTVQAEGEHLVAAGFQERRHAVSPPVAGLRASAGRATSADPGLGDLGTVRHSKAHPRDEAQPVRSDGSREVSVSLRASVMLFAS